VCLPRWIITRTVPPLRVDAIDDVVLGAVESCAHQTNPVDDCHHCDLEPIHHIRVGVNVTEGFESILGVVRRGRRPQVEHSVDGVEAMCSH
jgi:hypothetical protein